MLSRTISRDEAVQALSCDTARLLFTWLIPHADNLGRLNGDPAWVLATVFPRRRDLTLAQVAGWLEEMSQLGLVRWYMAKGLPVLAFPEDGPEDRRWSTHQKLNGNMRRSSDFPAPTDAGCTPYVHGSDDVRREGEGEGKGKVASSLRSEAPPAPVDNSVDSVETQHRRDLRRLTEPDVMPDQGELGVLSLVRGLAQAKALDGPNTIPFPNDAAWAWIKAQAALPARPRDVMEFMAWAWKHVGRDLNAIEAMVREWQQKRVVNPRAYFSANGPGGCRMAAAASDRAEAESAEHKRDLDQWLGGR